jgi:hypothetical protein
MKLKFIHPLFVLMILSLIFPSWVFSSQSLPNTQITQIEDRLRHVFQLQNRNINNHLLRTYQSLDNFLFGPGINDKLLRYFNKHVKPGKFDDEVLWEKFRKEVLNKKEFMQFVEEMTEIHLRVYEKIRHETNREFVAMEIEGIPFINFENERQKLREQISEIWDLEESELREIISSTAGVTKDLNTLEHIDLYVMGTSVALEVLGTTAMAWESLAFIGSAACPPCGPILIGASIAIMIGWFIYKDVIKGRQLKEEMSTAQQRFMINMTKTLEQISSSSKDAFQEFSDKTYEKLIDIIITLVIKTHPQIRRENLL